jgi:prepilin-type N-terminal cleavage/methylation domain-containing protein
MRQFQTHARPSRSAGFTLIELLVVMGVIAVAAAVSLPAIARYIKNYQIRGATRQVAGEIQAARNRAITKNVSQGVVFVTRDASTYQWAVEDDQTGVGTNRVNTRPTMIDTAFLADPGQASPVFSLPRGVTFSTTCPSPALPTGAWDRGMRFNRLGAWCDPTGTTGDCPNNVDPSAGATFIYNITAGDTVYTSGSVICLTQTSTGLSRTVAVLGGGRVVAQP